jgi:hypothetical protein
VNQQAELFLIFICDSKSVTYAMCLLDYKETSFYL